MKLWLVKIHDDDFRWGHFVSAVVWADTPEQAEQTVRHSNLFEEDDEKPRLIVELAPQSGVAHARYASA